MRTAGSPPFPPRARRIIFVCCGLLFVAAVVALFPLLRQFPRVPVTPYPGSRYGSHQGEVYYNNHLGYRRVSEADAASFAPLTDWIPAMGVAIKGWSVWRKRQTA